MNLLFLLALAIPLSGLALLGSLALLGVLTLDGIVHLIAPPRRQDSDPQSARMSTADPIRPAA
jgi:hypothetical protein